MKTLDKAAGKFYMNNGKFGDELLLENQIQKKKEEELVTQASELYLEASQKKQEEINRKLETLELVPMSNRVVLSMYPENPYRKVIEGKIIVDYDGSFINPDSGEKDKMKQLVACAEVIEIGPECKFLQPGDDVYFDPRSCYPLPFMSLGYLLTTEPQIHCILNEGLKARFKMNKNE